jgi:hypothetical protein
MLAYLSAKFARQLLAQSKHTLYNNVAIFLQKWQPKKADNNKKTKESWR